MAHILYSSSKLEDQEKVYLEVFHTTLLDETELFVTFSLQEYRSRESARVVFDRIKNTAFDFLLMHRELPSYERFEETLKQVNDELRSYQEKQEDHFFGVMDACIGFLSAAEFHLSKVGDAECYLLRKGDAIDISEGLYDPVKDTGEFFVNIASGDLKKHDKILFATRRLTKFVGKTDLTSIFVTSDMESSLQELSDVLAKTEIGSVASSGFALQSLGASHTRAVAEIVDEEEITHKPSPLDRVKDGGMRAWKKFTTTASKEERKKVVMLVLVVVVVLLGLSLLSTFGKQKSDQYLAAYGKMLEEARQEIHAARTESTSSNKERAKKLLSDARGKLTQLREAGIFLEDVDGLLGEVKVEEEQMDNIERVEEPRVFADLTEILGEENIKDIINTDRGLYAYTDTSVIGPILDTRTSSYSKETLPEGNTIVGADYFEDRGDLVFLLNPAKVAEFHNGVFQFVDTVDRVWKNAVDIKTYAQRNFVYLLDAKEGQIWRYRRQNKNYSSPSEWISAKEDRALIDKDVVSFAIDGFLYVLKKDGSMYKFYDGKRSTPFQYQDMPSDPLKDLDEHSQVFVRQNLKRLYVLDHPKSRVLVLRKDPVLDVRLLRYERQFLFQGKNIRGISVNDDEITMFAADEKRIYKVDL